MKKTFVSPLILFIFLSLACSVPFGLLSKDVEPSAIPEVDVKQEAPQEVANPTNTVYAPPTARPTSDVTATPEPSATLEQIEVTPTEPVALCPPYGIEEFDSPNDCWPDTLDEVFAPASISNRNKVFVQVANSRLEFESQLAEDVFLYSFYKENEYDEVNLLASITKIEPSVNQNGFALACHVNEDGWYEVRIESSGTFDIFQYDSFKKQNDENPYVSLGNGGAAAYRIGTGRENIIEWQCRYDSLTLIINGKQTWEKKGFTSINSGGGVGVGLASYSGKLPRHIAFEYVEIVEP
jgi:hypothetical protein